jgi:magnesium transporter
MRNESPSEKGVGPAAGAATSTAPLPPVLTPAPATPAVVLAAPAWDKAADGPATSPLPAGPSIRAFSIQGDVCRDLEGDAALAELEKACQLRQARVWIDLCDPTPAIVAEVGRILELHPLLIEDLCERDQRAKLEQMGDFLHVVLFSLGFDDGKVYDREIDFVLGQRFLLSNHSHWWDPRRTHHLRAGIDPILRRGPDYLMWALADDSIDGYFPMLDRLGDEIDALEDAVVARADRALLERLFELKRELILIRRVTAPEREMFNVLSSREETPISPEIRIYYRDAYDHLIRLTDELDTYRELASAALETYLSTVNNNLSLIMKRLTGVTVVVAGIGAIGGIFGMSEAQFAFRGDEGPGFWIVSAGSLILAAIAVVFLRRIDWI